MPSAASLSIRGVSFPRTDPYAPTSPHPRLSGKIRPIFGRAAWADTLRGIARTAARNPNPSRLTGIAASYYQHMDGLDAFGVTCPYCGEEMEIHIEEDV